MQELKKNIREIVEVREDRELDNQSLFHNDILSSLQIRKLKYKTHNAELSSNQDSSERQSSTKNPNHVYIGNSNIQADITKDNESQFKLKKIGEAIKGETRRLRSFAQNLDLNQGFFGSSSSFFKKMKPTSYDKLTNSPTLIPKDQDFATESTKKIFINLMI